MLLLIASAVVSLGLLLSAAWLRVSASQRSRRALATVVGHERVEYAEGPAFFTRVAFDDVSHGRREERLGHLASFPAVGELGDQIPIRYDSNRSTVVRDSKVVSWGPLLLLVAALGLLAVGLGNVVLAR